MKPHLSILVLLFVTICPNLAISAYADGVNQKNSTALKTCLSDNHLRQHSCFDVAYYSCMGEQLHVAPNANLARERCIYQEFVVWQATYNEKCNHLKAISKPIVVDKYEVLCGDKARVPNWSYLLKNKSTDVHAEKQINLTRKLSTSSYRTLVFQIDTLLMENKTRGLAVK